MAYEYDRFEREEGSGAFLMGLLAGTVLGAGLGMLFAPRTGSELRSQLSDQAGKWRNTASDAYQQVSDKVTHFAERGREMYEQQRRSGSATGTAGDTTSGATGTTGSDLGASGSFGSTGGDFGSTGGSGKYGGNTGNSGL